MFGDVVCLFIQIWFSMLLEAVPSTEACCYCRVVNVVCLCCPGHAVVLWCIDAYAFCRFWPSSTSGMWTAEGSYPTSSFRSVSQLASSPALQFKNCSSTTAVSVLQLHHRSHNEARLSRAMSCAFRVINMQCFMGMNVLRLLLVISGTCS